jgi:hypothetical protein
VKLAALRRAIGFLLDEWTVHAASAWISAISEEIVDGALRKVSYCARSFLNSWRTDSVRPQPWMISARPVRTSR